MWKPLSSFCKLPKEVLVQFLHDYVWSLCAPPFWALFNSSEHAPDMEIHQERSQLIFISFKRFCGKRSQQLPSIIIRNHSAQTVTVPHTSIYMDLFIQAMACMSVVFFSTMKRDTQADIRSETAVHLSCCRQSFTRGDGKAALHFHPCNCEDPRML